jgi:hypothetical protein
MRCRSLYTVTILRCSTNGVESVCLYWTTGLLQRFNAADCDTAIYQQTMIDSSYWRTVFCLTTAFGVCFVMKFLHYRLLSVSHRGTKQYCRMPCEKWRGCGNWEMMLDTLLSLSLGQELCQTYIITSTNSWTGAHLTRFLMTTDRATFESRLHQASFPSRQI